MIKKFTSLFTTLVLSLSLCTPAFAANGSKQTAGTIFGAIGGGLLGSQFGKGRGRLITTAIGTFVGSQIGGSMGARMDARDQQLANRNAVYTLENMPDRRVRRWRNPNNNHSGNCVITRTKEYPRSNKVCRDYVQTVIIDGENVKLHGRACRDVRDPKGMWVYQK